VCVFVNKIFRNTSKARRVQCTAQKLVDVKYPFIDIPDPVVNTADEITERYTHIASATARAAVEKLEGVPKQVPTKPAEEVAAL